MSLSVGARLSHYEVTAKIGEGGMGGVYRARDTKLDRDVALKVLPQAFTDDPDRLARFEREAKVLASLNHPNIGHIYRLEEAEGQKALVLELVEGSTLAERIKHGPIPVDEALPIANCPAVAQDSMVEKGPRHRGAGRGDGPGGAPVAEVQRLCGPSRHRRRVPGPRAGSHRSGTSRLRQIPDRSTRESVR